MDETRWTFRAGRVLGIPLRIHWALVIVAGYFVYQGFVADLRFPSERVSWTLAALLGVVVLWVSVLLHELGHCGASRAYGSEPSLIVLWPLGGLAVGAGSPGRPGPEAVVYAAGPAVSALLAGVGWLGMWLVGWEAEASLLERGFAASGYDVFRSVFQINGCLLLFNLLPAFPLDGGGILRALLWKRSGDRNRATLITVNIARVVLIVVGVVAVVHEVWLTLAVALWALMEGERTARLAEAGELEPAQLYRPYAYGGGEEAAERPGRLARWRKQRRENRRARQEQAEAELREQVDVLLARVSRDGLESLSEAERKFLRKVSRHYRSE